MSRAIFAVFRLQPNHVIHVDLTFVLGIDFSAMLAYKVRIDQFVGELRAVYFIRLTSAFDPLGGIYRITPDVIGPLFLANYPQLVRS